jgi:hypothetical protein
MSFRDSLSTLKKDVKRRLKGKKLKPDKTGADAGGERVASVGSPSGSEHPVVGGSGQGQEGTNTVGGHVDPADGPTQQGEPSPWLRLKANRSEKSGRQDVDGTKVGQIPPNLDPDVEVVVGSGGSGEIEPACPSPSAASIPQSVKPDGM